MSKELSRLVRLVLIRGLPGSGKSSLGATLSSVVLAADDYYMTVEGVYVFDPRKLGAAHADCRSRTRDALRREIGDPVVVTNTFSQRWEVEPYLRLGVHGCVEVCVVDLFDGGLTDEALVSRGLHSVPIATIAMMRARWEHNLDDGDPRPPWERG